MFKFFKEKLKSWVGKSKKDIEDKAEKVDEEEKVEEIEEEEEKPEKPEEIKEELETIDEEGKIIRKESREKIHKEGLLHREVHVWVYNDKGEILFQKRAPNKDTFPNLFDASAGGHVDIGEDYLSAGIRELEEETGIKAEKEDLVLIGEFKKKAHDKSTDKTNYATKKIYAYYFKGKEEELNLEKNKATKLKFWPIKSLFNLSKEEEKEFIPTLLSKEYFLFYKKIEKLIEEPEHIEPIKRTAPTIEELETEEKKKTSFLGKIKGKFSYKITDSDFEEIFNNLELLLLENNVALEAVEKIKSDLKEELIDTEIKKEEIEQAIIEALKKSIDNLLIEPDDMIPLLKEKQPFIIVFFGVNGTGKTTTIAKFAHMLQKNKLSCVLAASDTFRAASIEQLKEHADKLKIKMIKHDYGADPAAVAFDAIKHAKAHKIDVVLIDTAGRMHTKGDLLAEMEKICRVTDPDLKILVAESIAGNDAIQQAKNFNDSIGIDGSILTKADVDEKGGTAISISYVTKKPILYLGTGQKYDDLELFDKEKFIKQLGL